MAARVGFKLVTFQTQGTEPTTEPPCPSYVDCFHYLFRPNCDYVTTDTQSVGRVHVFKSLALAQQLDGEDEFEQLGFSVKIAVWNGLDVAILSSTSGGKLQFF